MSIRVTSESRERTSPVGAGGSESASGVWSVRTGGLPGTSIAADAEADGGGASGASRSCMSRAAAGPTAAAVAAAADDDELPMPEVGNEAEAEAEAEGVCGVRSEVAGGGAVAGCDGAAAAAGMSWLGAATAGAAVVCAGAGAGRSGGWPTSNAWPIVRTMRTAWSCGVCVSCLLKSVFKQQFS